MLGSITIPSWYFVEYFYCIISICKKLKGNSENLVLTTVFTIEVSENTIIKLYNSVRI